MTRTIGRRTSMALAGAALAVPVSGRADSALPDKPLKILGHGEIGVPLFVVADAFSRTAISKIEAAGGSVNVLEVPGTAATSDQETAAAEG